MTLELLLEARKQLLITAHRLSRDYEEGIPVPELLAAVVTRDPARGRVSEQAARYALWDLVDTGHFWFHPRTRHVMIGNFSSSVGVPTPEEVLDRWRHARYMGSLPWWQRLKIWAVN